MPDKVKDIHAGHRKGVRERYIKRGSLDDYADHQILEMLLFYAIARRDVNPLAHKLIDRFGSLHNVLRASFGDLIDAGLSENTATLLKLVGDIGPAIDRNALYGSKLLGENTNDLLRACYKLLFREAAETIVLLCLDVKSRVTGIYKRTDGSFRRVAAMPKWIVEKAMYCNAASVVLVHNHPSGSALPSQADIKTAVELKQLLEAIGIALQDSVIVTKNACYSICRDYLLEDTLPEDDEYASCEPMGKTS